jgi:hypothetical protein
MFASFTTEHPTMSASDFTAIHSDEHIFISHLQPSFCPRAAGMCELRISVYGYPSASFTLTVTQEGESRIRLVDGMPQRGTVEHQQWQYYSFEVQGRPGLD